MAFKCLHAMIMEANSPWPSLAPLEEHATVDNRSLGLPVTRSRAAIRTQDMLAGLESISVDPRILIGMVASQASGIDEPLSPGHNVKRRLG